MNGVQCDDCGAGYKPGILESLINNIVKTILKWRKLADCSICNQELCGSCILGHECK